VWKSRRNDVKYRRVGSSGLQLSVVSLGTWLTYGEGVDERTARALVDIALSAGVNFFDTADAYAGGQAERVLGEALRSVSRQEYVVASKCFFPTGSGPTSRGLSRKHVFDACEGSLRRMGLEYIDLYQCHRFDPETPLLETITALTDLVRIGKIRYWGFSQWTEAQIREAIEVADRHGLVRPVSDQARYNLLDRAIESDVIPLCAKEGIGVLAYSPLAQGVLSGKYRGGRVPAGSRASDPKTVEGMKWRLTSEDLVRVDKLGDIAAEMGVPTATLALAWCLRIDAVATVICGARHSEQLASNLAAADLDLADVTVSMIEGIV
jgi:voltage-dependent potassium channel beta subunit